MSLEAMKVLLAIVSLFFITAEIASGHGHSRWCRWKCIRFLRDSLKPENVTSSVCETMTENFDLCAEELGLNITAVDLSDGEDPCQSHRGKRSIREKRHGRQGHRFCYRDVEEFLEELDPDAAVDFRMCFLAENGFISGMNNTVDTDRLIELAQDALESQPETLQEVEELINSGDCTLEPDFEVYDYLRCISHACF